MTFKKTDTFPYLLFFTSFVIYLFTAVPSIYWRDAAEFQTIGFLLDIAHPSGSPLYAIVAKLFTLIPLGNLALRVTLFSAFFGALVVVLLYFIIQTVLRQFVLDRKQNSKPSDDYFIDYLSLSVALLFLFSLALWQNSIIPEVYTFQNFFTGLFILLLLKMTCCRSQDKASLNHLQLFLCLAFLLGLGLGSHSILVLYLPLLLVFVYFTWLRPESLPLIKTYSLLAFFFCIGFSIYLYLPIRSTQNPYYDWGNSETFKNLMDHVSDKKDASYHFSFPVDRMVFQLKLYGGFYINNFSLLGVALGGIGLIALIRRKKYRVLTLFALFFLPPFLFFVRWWWEESAFIPNFLIFSVFIAIGLFIVSEWSQKKYVQHPRRKLYLTFVVSLLAIQLILLVGSHASQSNKADYWSPRKLMKDLLSSLPPNAIVFTGRTTFPFIHLQQSEGYRPDLSIIGVSSFQAPELFLQVDAAKFPDITIPEVPTAQLGSAFLNQNIDEHPIYWEPDADSNALVEKYLIPDAFLFKVARQPAPLDSEIIQSYLKTLAKQINFEGEIKNYQERLFYALTIVAQGRFFLERGAVEIARRHFELVVGLVPDDTHFQNILAVSYVSLEQFDQAEATFFKSISLAPENIAPYLNLAKMYADNGSVKKAEQFFKAAIAINPDHLDAIIALGKLNAEQGNTDAARAHFQKAMQLSPENEVLKREIENLQEP